MNELILKEIRLSLKLGNKAITVIPSDVLAGNLKQVIEEATH